MANLDYGLLAKILGRLGSSHDGEVLAAARKAHELLSRAGITWGELLSRDYGGPRGTYADSSWRQESEDILRQTADAMRRKREELHEEILRRAAQAQDFGDELRRRQADRERKWGFGAPRDDESFIYTAGYDPAGDGGPDTHWHTKGPY